MFESQGTTPASQDSTIPATLEEALIRGSELQLEILDLKHKLDLATETAQNWKDQCFDNLDVITKAREMFQDILAGDMDPSGTIEDFREPFALLGVAFTQEVEVEITATWTVTVTKPFGYELDGHNDFTCEINSDSNEITLHDSWHTPDIEVREL